MKNILFINPAHEIRHPPLGLGYLAGYINKYFPDRYRFKLVDYAMQTDRDLEQALAGFVPDLIGITATTNSFFEAKRIAQLIKAKKDVPIILGGVHITAVPEDLLDSPFDLAVLGEGEETFLEVLRYLDQTGGLINEHLKGVAYQVGDNLAKTPDRLLIADLDQVPMPDYSLFAMREFYAKPKALAHGFYAKGASMMPSRGCPYGDCSFCSSGIMWHKRVRFFSPSRVFEEMSYLIKTYDLNSIIFLDDNLTTKRSWLEELAEHVTGSDFFPYFKFDCESIAEFINDRKAQVLKAMGCERIEFGFESGCQRILKELKNHRVNVQKSIEAIHICRDHKIKTLGNFIFGWFDETPEEIIETYDFIQKHPMDYVAWHTLAPYPGTRVWGVFEEKLRQTSHPLSREALYNLETCNTHLNLNPFLDSAQAADIYQKMRRQAYLANTNIIHELNLSDFDRQELWEAFWGDMERLQIKKPGIVFTEPNSREKARRDQPPENLASLCRELEENLPVANHDIMAEFDLITGHPWEHHASASATNYYACLCGLARSIRPGRILEIGTGFGLSAAALLKACETVEFFVTLDLGIFAEEYGFPENNLAFARRKVHDWCQRQGVSAEKAKFFQANTQPPGKTDNDNIDCQAPHWSQIPELQEILIPESFDLLFVDGKHTEDGLYNDLKTFWPFLKPGGLLICDDLHDMRYQGVFPWAGDTLNSFETFTSEFAAEIGETCIWDFPQVLPPTWEGRRPFGIIRKENPNKHCVQPEARGKAAGATRNLPDFASIIQALAYEQKRLYYRDQSPQSLKGLVELAEAHQPTKIIELGTLSGLSLRAWLAADTRAEITAIDLSFAALNQSQKAAPLDLSRVRMLGQDILTIDFSGLWGPEDQVLLYVDAHDQPQAPLMDYLLKNALPRLPSGSLVVVDDLWPSNEVLTEENVHEFFFQNVLNEIDPLQCFAGRYASYWQGGSFLGFAEITPLSTWVNEHQISLRFQPGQKFVSFPWPRQSGAHPEKRAKSIAFSCQTGKISYNPLEGFALYGAKDLHIDRPTLLVLNQQAKAAELYHQGKVAEALACLEGVSDLKHKAGGIFYARALCLARLGRFQAAAGCLEGELRQPFPHFRARQMLEDIHVWLRGDQNLEQIPKMPEAFPGLTIFACPKAFQGHTGIIQRNAIQSWIRLNPRPEIILFGNDPGIAEIARELGLRHVAEVQVSPSGAPLVRDLFAKAQSLASHPTLAYVNADIMLMQDFMAAAIQADTNFPEFLMVGQRWDVDQEDPIDFCESNWPESIRAKVSDYGTLHVVSALDYFVFTRNLWPEIPDFALGRTAWDNWLAAEPLLRGAPLIDATGAVTAIHQNHDYRHIRGGEAEVWKGDEAQRNQALAWASPFLCYSSHATWELTKDGQLKERKAQERIMALGREGWTLLQAGQPDQALGRFDEMLRHMPEGIPGLLYLRGLALTRLGRRDEAIAALKEELGSHPSHQRARELLSDLEVQNLEPEKALPKISVVIPTYNRGQYLEDAVKSVLSQDYADLEVLVVDDGSTDETSQVMSRLGDPRVRYLQKAHTGAPDTRNFGIGNARGEWLLWVDSDDALMPGWLAKLDSLLQNGSETDVYYGNLVVIDPQGQPLNTIRYEDFAGREELLLPRLLQENPLPLPGSLIRISLLREVGGFDVNFPRAHDYELWTRLATKARFGHVNFLAVKWRWHDGNMSSGSVNRDLSYDAEIVKRLLKRHSLKELFPDLNWDEWPEAQAQAGRRVGEILARYGDHEAAAEWLKESTALESQNYRTGECAAQIQ